MYKCIHYNCPNEGIFPVIHSGVRVAVATGTGTPVHVCADCLKAKAISKQTISHINAHCLSVHEWRVEIITKGAMKEELFRNLQRDGYAVERITHGHKYGRAVADCSALNSVAKYVQHYAIASVKLHHIETGAEFDIPSEHFNAKELRPMKDALRQFRYGYLTKYPYFTGINW